MHRIKYNKKLKEQKEENIKNKVLERIKYLKYMMINEIK